MGSLSVRALVELRADLGDETYHKALVELAFKSFRAGNVDECAEALYACDKDYFEKTAIIHAQNDEDFQNMVLYLGYKLVQTSMVDVDITTKPTQNQGKA